MRLFLAFLLCLTSLTVTVGQTVSPTRIVLTDARQQPLPGATVRLVSRTDSLRPINTLTDSVGVARVSLQTGVLYSLTATMVGMKPLTKGIRPTANQTLFRFVLDTDAKTLGAVNVVAQKPLMRQEDDMTVVDPEPIANSSTNAFEIIERTPGLFVDQDGNVYLNSSTPANIYVNGREQRMSASDLATMLKNLPPNSIEKIEIMRTPSAKYDASGSGGAVNIVLKKGVKLGRTGSVTANMSQGRFGNQGVGVNLSNSNGGRSSYGNLNFSHRDNYEQTTTVRQLANGQTVSQDAFARQPAEVLFAGWGTSLETANRWTLSVDGRASHGVSHYQTDNLNLIRLGANTRSQTQNDVVNRGRTIAFMQGFATQYKIDTLGSEFTTDLSYSYLTNTTGQDYSNQMTLPKPMLLLGDGTFQTGRHFFTAMADLRYKLPHKITLETGLKTAWQQFSSRTEFFTQTETLRQADRFRTNTFDYTDGIHAVYAQASKGFGAFLLKTGVRLENTNMTGHQRVPRDTTFKVNRTDLFPYVYLSRKVAKIAGYELRAYLVYRRSITRPGYEQLNPFARYIDQFLYETGNPALQPQFTQNIEANVSANEMPILAIGRNDSRQLFTSVLYQDPTTPSVAFRTYDNLGFNRETYFRLLGGIPPGGKFFFAVGAQYNHNQYTGQYEGQPLAFSRGSWSFFTFQQIKLDTRSTVNINGFYRLRGQQQFYELGDFGNLNISVNRYFLNRKLMGALSVSDVFYTNRNTFTLTQGNIVAEGARRADTRRFGVNIRYNFGMKKRDESQNPFSFDALERNSR
ncbi:MAG: TonB-dependent receptor [Cytophagales bacterium]|nr:MAG: TonB-dependent receptor [Cytophagales bacterium]